MYTVYLSAPLKAGSHGSIRENCDRADTAAAVLLVEYRNRFRATPNMIPMIVVPHKLMRGLAFDYHREYGREYGMKCCMSLLIFCNEIVVAGSIVTDGMQKEIEAMAAMGRVITRRPDLITY